MALIYVKVYTKLWYAISSSSANDSATISEFLSGVWNPNNVSALSITPWWNALDWSVTIVNSWATIDEWWNYILYQVTPTKSATNYEVWKFYKNWEEYDVWIAPEWWNITGTLSNQTDLSTALAWKQATLATQTAYTSKWSATKVPQITTNTLWQVTWITEVDITHPSQVSDTAYWSSWDGVTSTAPSKNAVYDKINSMDSTILWKQAQHSAITVTLTSVWWSSNTQTVTATWVTASNTVIISPAPSSFADYTSAVIYCSAQGSNSLTFTCTDEPTSNITVNVMILN